MSPKFYEVSCLKHGRYLTKSDENLRIRHVVVGVPRSKRERREGGCPFCIKELTEGK
jgi:hypothetical protein